MVKDGNGNGQTVGQALLVHEKRESLEAFFTAFYGSVAASCVRTILVDKDFTEISVLRSLWPDAEILLCRFHVLKALRQHIANSNMPSSVAENVKDVLQKLVHAPTEERYNQCLERLQQLAPPPAFWEYFMSNWDSCRKMWAFYITKSKESYATLTTNFVESRHNVLKHTLTPQDSLAECLKKVISCQLGLETAASQKNQDQNMKHHYKVGETETLKSEIRALLTPLGAQLVVKELDASRRATPAMKLLSVDDWVDVGVEDKTYTVTRSSGNDGPIPACSCSFALSQRLPCRHIFKLAHSCWDSGFSDSWIPNRWKKSFQMPEMPGQASRVTVDTIPCPSPGRLGKRDKFRLMFSLLRVMADGCSDCGQWEFMARYELLQQLQELWSQGKMAAIAELVSTEHLAESTTPAVETSSLLAPTPAVVPSPQLRPDDASASAAVAPDRVVPTPAADQPRPVRPAPEDSAAVASDRVVPTPAADQPRPVRPAPEDSAAVAPDRVVPTPAADQPPPVRPAPEDSSASAAVASVRVVPTPAADQPPAVRPAPEDSSASAAVAPDRVVPTPAANQPPPVRPAPEDSSASAAVASDRVVPTPAADQPPAVRPAPEDSSASAAVAPDRVVPTPAANQPPPVRPAPEDSSASAAVASDRVVPTPAANQPRPVRPAPEDSAAVASDRVVPTPAANQPRPVRPAPEDSAAVAPDRVVPTPAANQPRPVRPAPEDSAAVASDRVVPTPAADQPPPVRPAPEDSSASAAVASVRVVPTPAANQPPPVRPAPEDSSASAAVASDRVVPTPAADQPRPVRPAPEDSSASAAVASVRVVPTPAADQPPAVRPAPEDSSASAAVASPQLRPGNEDQPKPVSILQGVTFKLPPAVAPRGRPKGASLNAIGLPYGKCKRKKKQECKPDAKRRKGSVKQCFPSQPAKRKLSASDPKSRKRKCNEALWALPISDMSDEDLQNLFRQARRYPIPVTDLHAMSCPSETNPSTTLCQDVSQLDSKLVEASFDVLVQRMHQQKGTLMANHKESNHFQLVNALVVGAHQMGLPYGDLLNTLDPIPYHKELKLDMLSVRVPKATSYLSVGCFSVHKDSLLSLQNNGNIDDEVVSGCLLLGLLIVNNHAPVIPKQDFSQCPAFSNYSQVSLLFTPINCIWINQKQTKVQSNVNFWLKPCFRTVAYHCNQSVFWNVMGNVFGLCRHFVTWDLLNYL